MTPIPWDITVPTKNAPWGGAAGDGDFVLIGYGDWSGANVTAFKLQVRDQAGQTGTARFTLSKAAAGSEGVSASYVTDYADPDTGAEVPASTVRIQIAEATLSALDWGQTPPDEPLALAYDLLVTLSTMPEQLLLTGQFIVYPGVTI